MRAGRGIGERLLEDCFERARAAGHGRVQLDVYDGNPAQRLYERVGMRTIVETRVNALEADGIGVHLRMEIWGGIALEAQRHLALAAASS